MALDHDSRSHRISGLMSAHLSAVPARQPPTRRKGAYGNGLRYEKRVGGELLRQFGRERVTLGPWYRFVDLDGIGNCQPDAIVAFDDFDLIVEAKSSHTRAAWQQLVQLYHPVVTKASGRPALLLEMTRSHDPAVKWPCHYELLFDHSELDHWLAARNPERNLTPAVYVWKP